jgi:hypothetical protein
MAASGQVGSPLKFFLAFDFQDQSGGAVQKLVVSFQDVSKAAEGASEAVDHLGARTHSVAESMREVQEMGHGMMAAGERGLHSIEGMFERVVDTAAEFETLGAQMGFAFGDGAEAAYGRVQDFANRSVYELKDVTEAVAGLRTAFHEIDPTLDATANGFRNKSGEMISALDALSDASAGAGTSLGATIQAVEGALEGMYIRLQHRYRLSHSEIEQVKRGVAAAHTEQEKFNAVVQVLAAHWGGAQAAMARTYAFAVKQLPDIRDQLLKEIGKGALEPMKDFMVELVGTMQDTLHDEQFLAPLRDGFTMLGQIVKAAATWFFRAVRYVREFVKQNPQIVRMGIIIAAVGSALLVVVGAFVTAAATIGLAVAALSGAWGTIVTVVTGLGVSLLALGPVIAGLIAIGTALKEAWESDFGGIRTFFERVILIVRGLREAFQDWGEDTVSISEETAQQMDQAGIFDHFMELVGWLERARKFVRGLWEGMREGWEQVAPRLRGAFTRLSAAFRHVGETIEHMLVKVGLIQPAAGTSFQQATNAGLRFADFMMKFVAPVIEYTADIIHLIADAIETFVIPAVAWLIMRFGEMKIFVMAHLDEIKGALKVIGFIVGIVLLAVFGAVVVVVGAIAAGVTVAALSIYGMVRGVMQLWQWVKAVGAAIADWFNNRVIEGASRILGAVGHVMGVAGGPTERATMRGMPVAPSDDKPGMGETTRVPNPYEREMTLMAAPSPVMPADEAVKSGTAGNKGAAATAVATLREPLRDVARLISEQNALIRSGALRPVLENEAIAGAARHADADHAARTGALNTRR